MRARVMEEQETQLTNTIQTISRKLGCTSSHHIFPRIEDLMRLANWGEQGRIKAEALTKECTQLRAKLLEAEEAPNEASKGASASARALLEVRL